MYKSISRAPIRTCLAFPGLKGGGDIDNIVVNFRFTSDSIRNIDMSRNVVSGYDIRTEVQGTEGSLWIGYLQQTPTLVLIRGGVTHDTIPYFLERFGSAYVKEILVFVNNIFKYTEPDVTGENARAATAIGIAATLPLDKQRPVLFSEILKKTNQKITGRNHKQEN